jgi:hypothetical protein
MGGRLRFRPWIKQPVVNDDFRRMVRRRKLSETASSYIETNLPIARNYAHEAAEQFHSAADYEARFELAFEFIRMFTTLINTSGYEKEKSHRANSGDSNHIQQKESQNNDTSRNAGVKPGKVC